MRIAVCTLATAMAVLATVASNPAISHDHATGVVKERMDMMEDMAKRLKAIRERVEQKRDLVAIKADAEAIAAHVPHLVHMFPPGSTQKPTQARRAIWQNWADFERLAKALETESKKLAGTSPDDGTAIATQVQAVSKACGSCHEKYRIRTK